MFIANINEKEFSDNPWLSYVYCLVNVIANGVNGITNHRDSFYLQL